MADTLTILREQLAALAKLLRKSRDVVERKKDRRQFREFVITYFETWRPLIGHGLADHDPLMPLDGSLQELLLLCNARTRKSKYQELISIIRSQIDAVDLKLLTAASTSQRAEPGRFSPIDQAILDTLKKLSDSAADSFDQGLRDLTNSGRRSWRGTVAEFREALRETLDLLAPDSDVVASHGFRREEGRVGPTMKQKVVFILKSRRATSGSLQTARAQADLIEAATAAFVRSVYDRSSGSTHGLPSRQEAISIKDHVTLVLAELLQVHANAGELSIL